MPAPLEEQIGRIRQRQRRQRRRPQKGGPTPDQVTEQSTGPGGSSTTTRTTRRSGRKVRGKHDWGDGKGPVHSISLAESKKNRVRAANDRNPLYNPAQQLSGDALKTAADDLVNLEFGPQRAALDRELGNVTTQGTALAQRGADYFQGIARTDAQLPGQVQAIGDLLNTRLAGNASESAAAIQAAAQGSRDRAAGDTSGVATGVQLGPVEAELQKQLGASAQGAQASRDTAASNTAAFAQLAQLSGGARAQMGQEIQGQLLNRLANQQGEVRGRQADLAGSERGARTEALTNMRQQAFENLITQKGLDIKGSELEAETAEANARLAEAGKTRRSTARQRAADRRSRESIATDNRTATERRADADRASRERIAADNRSAADKRAATGKGQKMPASARDLRTGIDNALIDTKDDPKLTRHIAGKNYKRVQEILQNRGAPPIVAKAAREIAENGKLSGSTISALRRAGMKVPRSWINPPYNRPGAAGPPAPGT